MLTEEEMFRRASWETRQLLEQNKALLDIYRRATTLIIEITVIETVLPQLISFVEQFKIFFSDHPTDKPTISLSDSDIADLIFAKTVACWDVLCLHLAGEKLPSGTLIKEVGGLDLSKLGYQVVVPAFLEQLDTISMAHTTIKIEELDELRTHLIKLLFNLVDEVPQAMANFASDYNDEDYQQTQLDLKKYINQLLYENTGGLTLKPYFSS